MFYRCILELVINSSSHFIYKIMLIHYHIGCTSNWEQSNPMSFYFQNQTKGKICVELSYEFFNLNCVQFLPTRQAQMSKALKLKL